MIFFEDVKLYFNFIFKIKNYKPCGKPYHGGEYQAVNRKENYTKPPASPGKINDFLRSSFFFC